MSEVFFGNDSFVVSVNGDTWPVHPDNGTHFSDGELRGRVGGEPMVIARWGNKTMYGDKDGYHKRKTVNAVAMMLVLKHTSSNDLVFGNVVVVKTTEEVKRDA